MEVLVLRRGRCRRVFSMCINNRCNSVLYIRNKKMDKLINLASFSKCEMDVAKIILANNGFSYSCGKIVCKTCNLECLEAKRLQTAKQVAEYHILESPDCSVAKDNAPDNRVLYEIKTEIGHIEGVTEPRATVVKGEEDYARYESRLRSFADWTSQTVSAEDLAEAGLYYTGPNDRVQCFSCKGGLYNWEAGDKPLEEHKKHFPLCKFVKNYVPETRTAPVRVSELQEQKKEEKAVVNDPYKGLCKVCLNDAASVIFLPCKHITCCAECAIAVTKCPLCRDKIEQIIRGIV